ncbi:MAG TPA: AzlD domain-containing protein [Thermohalobaculum sp.]|nr:AzlD domain-containing protein [Thermohalobaculum sp.]
MSDAAIWTVIGLLGLLTYLIRFSFLGLLAGRRLPGWAAEALGFVPVAVLPALVAPMVAFAPEGGGWADAHRPLAALITLGVGMATRNLLAAITAGMGAFWALRALGL